MIRKMSTKAQRWVLGGVAMVAAVAATGCTGIRVVRVAKDGGEIALLGFRDDAMQLAQAEMAQNCGGPGSYEIIEQGEVVVGQVSQTSGNSSTQAGRSWTGAPATYTSGNSSTTTSQRTEWRVKYACKGGATSGAIRSLSVAF